MFSQVLCFCYIWQKKKYKKYDTEQMLAVCAVETSLPLLSLQKTVKIKGWQPCRTWPAVGSKMDSKDSWMAAVNEAMAVFGTCLVTFFFGCFFYNQTLWSKKKIIQTSANKNIPKNSGGGQVPKNNKKSLGLQGPCFLHWNPLSVSLKSPCLCLHALLRRSNLLGLAAEAQQPLQRRRARRGRHALGAAQQPQLPVGRFGRHQLGGIPGMVKKNVKKKIRRHGIHMVDHSGFCWFR